MSLKSEPFPSVPEATARLAHIVCPKGGLCLWIGDELSTVFQDEQFASFFPRRGQPAEAPGDWHSLQCCNLLKGSQIDKL